jgi:hypothetical protein
LKSLNKLGSFWRFFLGGVFWIPIGWGRVQANKRIESQLTKGSSRG